MEVAACTLNVEKWQNVKRVQQAEEAKALRYKDVLEQQEVPVWLLHHYVLAQTLQPNFTKTFLPIVHCSLWHLKSQQW